MTDQETARLCLNGLARHRTNNYADWLKVGMACHAAGISCSEWDQWSQGAASYEPLACEKKWATFGHGTATVTVATLVHMAREDGATIPGRSREPKGEGHALDWNSPIGGRKAVLLASPVPTAPTELHKDLEKYLRAVFQPEDFVSYVLQAIETEKGKLVPGGRGTYTYTRDELLASIAHYGTDLESAIGTVHPQAGAWIRPNPVDGKGVGNANITDCRHTLVEADDMPLEDQLSIIRRLRLPCAAIVTSGGKSVHAIVKIDAGTDRQLYRNRVETLHTILQSEGFAVDPACKDPCRLSRLPGVKRGDQPQYMIDGPTGAPNWKAWEKERETAESAGKIQTLGELKTPISGEDPNEVIQSRYLSYGGGLLIVAPTGVGKSSLMLSIMMHFAIGREFLGLTVPRPQTSLIVQAENDEGDMAEMRDGILATMTLTPEEEATILANVRIVQDNTHTGLAFGSALRDYLTQTRPNLIAIDPALAFLGADASQQKDVSLFLRNILNPILTEYQAALLLIHHANKPQKTDGKGPGWQGSDFAYLGAGAAEWANWARAVIAIETLGKCENVFRMRLAKRGKRVGWTDQATGKPNTVRYIAHAKEAGRIAWRWADADEIPAERVHKTKADDFAAEDHLHLIIPALAGGYLKAGELSLVLQNKGLTKTQAEKLIQAAQEKGAVTGLTVTKIDPETGKPHPRQAKFFIAPKF